MFERSPVPETQFSSGMPKKACSANYRVLEQLMIDCVAPSAKSHGTK